MVLRGEASGRYLGHKSGSLLNRINIIIKETTQELLGPLPSHEDTGKRWPFTITGSTPGLLSQNLHFNEDPQVIFLYIALGQLFSPLFLLGLF